MDAQISANTAKYTLALITELENKGEASLPYGDGGLRFSQARGRLTNAAARAGLVITTTKVPDPNWYGRGRVVATVIGTKEPKVKPPRQEAPEWTI